MNKSGSRTFSRRFLLGGAGVTVALPFLESLQPRSANAQSLGAPKRLMFWWIPNGLVMDKFRPATTGAGYVLTPTLEPLKDFKNDLLVVTGLENAPGKPTGAGDHASGTAAFITCASANKSESDIRLGISADQVAAAKIGKETRLPSLELGIDGGSGAGNCDNGYSCAYTRNIAWSGPNTPRAKLTDPKTIFNQLFQGASPTQSQADIDKRNAYQKSVLDSVTADANSLRLKLGRTDQRKLDEYLTGVSELERQIGLGPSKMCTAGTAPTSNDFRTKVTALSDLMVLALQCDATRIVTYMLGNGISGQSYPWLTVNGQSITRGHHDISHHGNQQTNLDQLAAINRWTMEQFAYLLGKMKAVTEGSGTLLDNSTIFVSSDVSDGNRHNHDDMPIIIAGKGGGKLATGQHIAYPKASKEKVSNLLVSLLTTVGVDGGKVGDSTGALPAVLKA